MDFSLLCEPSSEVSCMYVHQFVHLLVSPVCEELYFGMSCTAKITEDDSKYTVCSIVHCRGIPFETPKRLRSLSFVNVSRAKVD